MKGSSSDSAFGYFLSISGKMFCYSKNGWEEQAYKSYYDELVGDIAAVLDHISTGESVETLNSIGLAIDAINGEAI